MATALTPAYAEALERARLDLAGSSVSAEPFSRSKTSNWVAKGGGLPHFIQHMAHDIQESDPAKSESAAIAIAISQCKKLAAKGNAKAAKAIAEWEALKAKNAAKKAVNASADTDEEAIGLLLSGAWDDESVPVGVLPGETALDLAGYTLALQDARLDLAVFNEGDHPRLHGKFAKKGVTAADLNPDKITASNAKKYQAAVIGARDFSDKRQKGGMVGPSRDQLDKGFAHGELRGSAGFKGSGMSFDHPVHGKHEIMRGSGDKYTVKHPDGETSTHDGLPDAVAHLRALGKKPETQDVRAQVGALADGAKVKINGHEVVKRKTKGGYHYEVDGRRVAGHSNVVDLVHGKPLIPGGTVEEALAKGERRRRPKPEASGDAKPPEVSQSAWDGMTKAERETWMRTRGNRGKPGPHGTVPVSTSGRGL